MKKAIWDMDADYWKGISSSNKKMLIQYLKDRFNSDKKERATVLNDKSIIVGLARFIKDKSFLNITERDMRNFFATVTDKSKDLTATKIILFYRKILKLKKKTRPPNMEWFDYTTKKQKQKHVDADAVEKYYITEEHYREIMRVTLDVQTRALFETLYVSGARPSEVCSMTIDSIEVNGGVIITVWESKTKPRKIYISNEEYPHELLRWLEIHPNKSNPKNWLWFSMSKRAYGQQLNAWGVLFRLKQACKKANIPRHKPHDFRKTRATIMFRDNFDDTMMAKHFGWEVERVGDRRKQYDLRGDDELRKKMFGKVERPETIEDVKRQRDTKISKMEKEMERQRKIINRLAKKLLDKEPKNWVEQEEVDE